MKLKEHNFEELTTKVSAYLPPENMAIIHKAYQFAQEAHSGQCRMSHEPYICHPLEVAIILAELEQDAATIAAALLHDTMEDCPIDPAKIQAEFGQEIFYLVDGVTKLGKINFNSEEEHLVENFRKMFLAMAKDLRVIIIKIADRLHNMRTLKYLSPERQQKIARETREIFAPLAHRLGMGYIKWELEDLCFYYLEPEEFQKIKTAVASRRDERESYIHDFVQNLKAAILPVCSKAKVVGRPKHFYSIYKKLYKQKCTYDDLYDTFGVRIIVNSVKECYELLGLIHSSYKPVYNRIKDFIAMPKSNMYQSLHTTIIGPEGKFVEIQIRTQEMDQIAENGIAAHWKYKEGKPQEAPDVDFTWLRQIIESPDEKVSPNEYLQNLKLNLFEDEVFIFTPKGDVQILPKGAVPLDFAYKVHTEVGHRYVGAKANGEIVSMDYALKNGDRLEILTAKKPNPKSNWLNVVKTNQAKTKIKQWLKKQAPAEPEPEVIEKPVNPPPTLAADILATIKAQAKSKKSASNGINVLGYSNIETHFVKCCAPLPGDAIIGFVTKGFGISVHRKGCKNVTNLPPEDQGRLIELGWDSHAAGNKLYSVTLLVEAFDRIGLLKDIIGKVAESKINIAQAKSRTLKKSGNVKVELVIDIPDYTQLEFIKNSLKSISDVYNVYRG